MSCEKHSVNDVVENFVLTIDFQGGFDQDQVKILLAKDIVFNDRITTNPTTSLAYHYEQTIIDSQVHLQILVNEETSLDTNLVITDSLYCGIIYDSLNKKLIYSILDKKPIYEIQLLNDLAKLQISILSVYGYASFFPVHPPDPIGVKIVMTFENTSEFQIINKIEFKEGRMYLPTGEFIGDFDLISWYDVNVYPFQTDTITVVKIPEEILPFEAPCDKYFYVSFLLEDKYQNTMFFETDSSYFGCDF